MRNDDAVNKVNEECCWFKFFYPLSQRARTHTRTAGHCDPHRCVITLQWLSELYDTVYDVSGPWSWRCRDGTLVDAMTFADVAGPR